MTPELVTQVLEDTRTAPSVPAATASPAAGTPEGVLQAVVAVVGLGYVGLPTAIALRSAGARIIGIDISAERLEEIRSGEAELLAVEQEQLGGYLQDGGFSLTDRPEALEAADLVLVCVPTPVDEERRPEPVALERACEAVVRHARAGQTFVLTSTSYVGAHPQAAGRAAPGAWAAGRGGGVRGVRPRAHRPGRWRARPAEHAARDRGRQRDLPPAGLVAAQPHLLGAAPGLLARGRRDGEAV